MWHNIFLQTKRRYFTRLLEDSTRNTIYAYSKKNSIPIILQKEIKIK